MKLNIKLILSVLILPIVIGFLSFGSMASAQSITSIPATNSSSGTGTSLNWSGYSISGSNITAINGSWVLPQITSSTSLTSDATWVGIGGVTSSDLIQIGTETFSSNGQITHQAFYETLPQVSQVIPIKVSAGDSITASLNEISQSMWSLSIRDNTNGQSFQTTVSYTSSLSSAEWIEEMPSNANNSFVSLDNFSTLQFSGGSLTENNNNDTIAQSNAQIITMMNASNQALATVSGLGSDGASFTVNRTSAIPTSSTNWQRSASSRNYRRGLGIQGYTRFSNGGSYRITSFGRNSRGFGMVFSRFFKR